MTELASKLQAMNEILIYGLANGWSTGDLHKWLQTDIGKQTVEDIMSRDDESLVPEK